ncbi:MAG: gliding motility-associated C-terminal domain-containing protein, partial [Bacteroidetes bacterium]|nr:gliding motility-associated C-terminal domain-containing protein [Bacteroidota bacterium]
ITIIAQDCTPVCEVEAGSISTNSPTTLCVGDGVNEIVAVSASGASAEHYVYIMSNTNNGILAISNSGNFTIESQSVGTYYISGLAYNGTISGLSVGGNVVNIEGCYDLSSNFITIIAQDCTPVCEVEAGSISTNSPTTLCINNGVSEVAVAVSASGASAEHYAYVMSNTTNEVLAISNSGNFTIQNAGTYYLWGIAYNGTISGLSVGNNVLNLEGCYDLSNNFITIIVEDCTPVCEEVLEYCTTAMTTIEVCVNFCNLGDGAHIIDAHTTYDCSLDIVGDHCLEYTPLPGFINMGDVIQIYGCDTAGQCDTVNISIFVGDCGESCLANAGTIVTSNPTTFVVNDGNADIVNVQTIGTTNGSSFSYFITDSNNNILSITNTPQFSFDNITPGIRYIWCIAYENTFTGLSVGNNISQFAGCYDLSNFLVINAQEYVPTCNVDAGTISTNANTNICLEGNTIVPVNIAGNVGPNYQLIVTDSELSILGYTSGTQIDFANYPEGTCFIFGLSYSGTITGLNIGNSISEVNGACYDLSNFITVNTSFCECVEKTEYCTPAMTSKLICLNLCDFGAGAHIVEANTTYNCSIDIEDENCLTYTPLPGYVNVTDTISILVCDNSNFCDIVKVNVYVGDCNNSTQNCSADAGPDQYLCGGFVNNNVQLSASGGLTYSWSPVTGLNNPNIANPVINTISATTTYTVTISDGSGCTDTDQVTIFIQYPPEYSVSDPVCISSSEFNITVSAVGGSGNYTAHVTNPDIAFLQTFNFSAPVTVTLDAVGSDYTVYVTDASTGCTTDYIIPVMENCANFDGNTGGTTCNTFLTLCTQPVVQETICLPLCDLTSGNAEITNYETTYNCSITILGESCLRYTALPGFNGIDTINVTMCDLSGQNCQLYKVEVNVGTCGDLFAGNDDIDIDLADGAQATFNILDNDSSNETINIVDYSYPLNGVIQVDAQGNVTYTPNLGFEGIDTFEYSITDANGEVQSATVYINVYNTAIQDDVDLALRPDCEMQLPNAFSPNGDGINDTYSIDKLACYQSFTFVVMNRWGQTVAEVRGEDTQNVTDLWNGTDFSGKQLQEGAYFYILELVDSEGNSAVKKGFIELKR